jgi:hypothetical protein
MISLFNWILEGVLISTPLRFHPLGMHNLCIEIQTSSASSIFRVKDENICEKNSLVQIHCSFLFLKVSRNSIHITIDLYPYRLSSIHPCILHISLFHHDQHTSCCHSLFAFVGICTCHRQRSLQPKGARSNSKLD